MDAHHQDLILAFVADLNFQARIEALVQPLGYRVRYIGNSAQIAPAAASSPGPQRGEPLQGPEGFLMEKVARWQPVLMLFDLDNPDIPWKTWLPILKTVPATRRIPILCFGPHVALDMLQAARSAGAEAVVSRARFLSALPELIEQHVQRSPGEALDLSCQQALHPKALEGLRLFNAGDYFGAHELLEEAWMEDLSPGRDLYRAILQVAVSYYHIRRGNYRGAVKMMLRARQWLEPLPETCRGVEAGPLRRQAYLVHDRLLEIGPERIGEFDRSLLKPVEWHP
ncbi:MAG: DUF309 domain-containing protein [Anaerolineales bacterium]|nr:DUF309 domain-containing protein [Anaerolineales bacterium]